MDEVEITELERLFAQLRELIDKGASSASTSPTAEHGRGSTEEDLPDEIRALTASLGTRARRLTGPALALIAHGRRSAHLADQRICPWHVMLAVTERKCVAARVLADAGMLPDLVRQWVDARCASLPLGEQPCEDWLEEIVSEACSHADDLGSPFVGTEHILLAALSTPGPVREALTEKGLTFETALTCLRRLEEGL